MHQRKPKRERKKCQQRCQRLLKILVAAVTVADVPLGYALAEPCQLSTSLCTPLRQPDSRKRHQQSVTAVISDS